MTEWRENRANTKSRVGQGRRRQRGNKEEEEMEEEKKDGERWRRKPQLPGCRSAGAMLRQQHFCSATMSPASYLSCLPLCHSACLFLLPVCLSFPPSLFTTGVIDQLLYWWLEEVEAVVPVVYITEVWFYGSLIAPYCLWWSTKDAPKKVCLLCHPSCLPHSILMVSFVFQMNVAHFLRLNRYDFFFLFTGILDFETISWHQC